mmetsp:Transcript_38845/g.77035  ORF Transcript_38845/g.77035 Transcript_38845/m.77035 type:complete len:200 (+) Transcript_38845:873-1472(+)
MSPSTWELRMIPKHDACRYVMTTPSHRPIDRRGVPISTVAEHLSSSLLPSTAPFSVWTTSSARNASSNFNAPRAHDGALSFGGRTLPALSFRPPEHELVTRFSTKHSTFPYLSKCPLNSALPQSGGNGYTRTIKPASLVLSPPGPSAFTVASSPAEDPGTPEAPAMGGSNRTLVARSRSPCSRTKSASTSFPSNCRNFR